MRAPEHLDVLSRATIGLIACGLIIVFSLILDARAKHSGSASSGRVVVALPQVSR